MSGQGVAAYYSSTTPLLPNEDDRLSQESVKDVSPEKKDSFQCQCQAWRPSLSKVVEEIKQLYAIALPMIITGLLIYGKSAISMFFMGKLGKEALAGGSLSIGIANITGYSVISGLAMGMEAISSQACGAKQWPLMGQTLQRTIAILTVSCLPISILWLNIEPILLFCGQDPVISTVASTYLAFSLPDLLFQSLINPLRIYLRTQNITIPLMLSAAFALALHAPINYILVYHLSLGIQGIAVAVALTDLNLLITLLLYLCFSGICDKTWQGWSLECFDEWKPILCLAIPTCISVCLEWWWYELMIVLSGLLTNAPEAVATMGILIQATSLIYIFPSSLSLAVSTRVGNELGANQPSKAKISSTIALSCAVLTSFMAMSFMTTMRNAWGQIFTNDKAILSLTAVVMPVAGLCELGNCPQTTGCGVLRGSARPTLGANINLGSFYGVGLPIAALMGFFMDIGLLGLWLGLLAAQVACAIVLVIVVAITDWSVQAKRARQLTGINAEEEEEVQSKFQGLLSVMLVN
ncbi:protein DETOXIFICATION 49-like [Herrania umbratica]|uniref:Protein DETOXIFICATION n=1 Tax=Herrania umbratica TaxID=108875 RepID=A0A6J0ZIB3_9ROSI|nr:protein DETOXIFICATION 49-like [Herrania umbratica]XP_021274617.1 protein DETOXIFICATION 49-like [Herrania umbratica]